MLTIDRMRLNLPNGFEHRGERIGRLVARKLGKTPVKADISIESLSVPAVHIHPAFTDEQVALRVADAIFDQIMKLEE